MIFDLAHELFPLFQLQEGEGIEDAINRVVPVLEDAREYQAKKLSILTEGVTRLSVSIVQLRRAGTELANTVKVNNQPLKEYGKGIERWEKAERRSLVLNKSLEDGAAVRISQHNRIASFNRAMLQIIELGKADTEDSREVEIAKKAMGYKG